LMIGSLILTAKITTARNLAPPSKDF